MDFMKKVVGFVPVVMLVLTFQSCENKSIDQEVQEYCDCQESVQMGDRDMKECLQIANDISDKYQFDPEAVDEIREKIKNCSDDQNDQND